MVVREITGGVYWSPKTQNRAPGRGKPSELRRSTSRTSQNAGGTLKTRMDSAIKLGGYRFVEPWEASDPHSVPELDPRR